MASPSISFRVTPDLAGHLAARADGTVTGAVAQAQLSRYFGFLDAQLSTVRLSREQALCLADILHSTLIDATWLRDPGRLLAWEVEDSAPDGLGEKWGVDLTELAAVCQGFTAGQGLAVLDAIERFRIAVAGDYDQALTEVGLLRTGREGL